MVTKKCISCGRTDKLKGISFLPLPTDPAILQTWCQALGIAAPLDPHDHKLCHHHFDDNVLDTKIQRKYKPNTNMATILPILCGLSVMPPPSPRVGSSPGQVPPPTMPPLSRHFGIFPGNTENVPIASRTTPTRPFGPSHGNAENIAPSTPTSSSSDSDSRSSTPEHRRENYNLQRQVDYHKMKRKEEKGFFSDVLGNLLSLFAPFVAMAHIFSMQIRRYLSRTRKRYNDMEKTISLTMFYALGEKGYHWLMQLGFKLPSSSSIHKWIGRLRFSPGYCQDIMDCMKEYGKRLNDKEKDCIISLDETELHSMLIYNKSWDMMEGLSTYPSDDGQRYAADKALVFMDRGVNTNWKFSLSYHFSKGPMPSQKLRDILLQTLSELKKIGYKVRAVVLDGGGTNRGLYDLLGVSVDQPYFLNEGSKIYALFDTPHLMKTFRNNIEKYGLIFRVPNDSVHAHWFPPSPTSPIGDPIRLAKATWQHFKEAYGKDIIGTSRLMPKIRHAHVYLTNWSKMKVKLATQVFSRSVSLAILTMANFELVTPDFLAFSMVAEKLNNIFDLLNISSSRSKNPLMRGDMVHKHVTTLRQEAQWFKDISFDADTDIPTLRNFPQTLLGMASLIEDLHAENYKYILTRRFQSDFLEHFFSFLKYRIGCAKNPTAVQFRQCFRYCFISTLIRSPEGANCEHHEEGETFEGCMENLRFILDKKMTTPLPSYRTNHMDSFLAAVSDSEDENESGGEDSNDDERTDLAVNQLFKGLQFPTEHIAFDNAGLIISTWAVKQCCQKTQCADCMDSLLEFYQDRDDDGLLEQEILLYTKAYKKDQFEFDAKKAKYGYAHLLKGQWHGVFREVNNKFIIFTKNSQNLFGTNVVRNLLRECREWETIRDFLDQTNVLCKPHRKDMLELIFRTKLYSLLNELNDARPKQPTFTKEKDG